MGEQLEIRQTAIDHHDRLAATFEDHYRQLDESRFASEFTYGRYKIDQMIDALYHERAGGAVLDVGCGTGEHLKRALAQGMSATGVEPAAAMREAAGRNAPGATVLPAVATALPFDAGQFDIVLEIEVLRYLHDEDIAKALAEAKRVLKPGGVVFVTLVNRWALDGFYVRQRLRQLRKRARYDTTNPHCSFFTPKSAARALREAGFRDIRIEARLFAPFRPLWRLTPSLARRLATRFERLDDRLHGARWARAFAGHLVAMGRA